MKWCWPQVNRNTSFHLTKVYICQFDYKPNHFNLEPCTRTSEGGGGDFAVGCDDRFEGQKELSVGDSTQKIISTSYCTHKKIYGMTNTHNHNLYSLTILTYSPKIFLNNMYHYPKCMERMDSFAAIYGCLSLFRRG